MTLIWQINELLLYKRQANNSSKIIGENVTEIRDAIGLSQKDFASLTGISRATLTNIESGSKPIKVISLDKIASFTSIGLDKLSKPGFKPPVNLREKLLELYRSSPEIYITLNNTPSIPYIIKYRAIKTGFLDTPKERGEIINLLKIITDGK